MERFEGWLEVDGESGAIQFVIKARSDALLRVTGIPTPLPLLVDTDSMSVDIKQAHCSFTTNTGSGREWWTKAAD